MEYQSLYRRYRPRRFAELRGQEHVVAALRNAVRDGRVAHAYLLSGPRGTGKTTAARILAKALNCDTPEDGEPCGRCESCRSIDAGTSFDLHELDAASNNKVDDIRELLARVALGTPGRTKVYLLDEVHMLTAGAENALLKTLEEPPAHVVFVLATTEPHRVVPTIRSRTQHLELSLIPADQLRDLVDFVVTDAGLDVDPAAVEHVLRVGGGSARDTLSALDQVVAAGGFTTTADTVDELLAALVEHDPARALTAAAAAVGRGREPRVVGEQLLAGLRDVFLVAMGAPPAQLDEAARSRAAELGRKLSPARITGALEVLGAALVAMRQAPDPRVDLDVALVRLTRHAAGGGAEDMASRVAELEARLARLEATGPQRATEAAAAPVPGVAAAGPAAAVSPPPPPRGGRPADAARRKLADRPPVPGRRAAAPAPPPEAAAEPVEPAAPPPASVPPEAPRQGSGPDDAAPSEPVPSSAPEPLPASAGALPGDIETALATALDTVRKGTRARFAAARFVGVDGDELRFGVPNEPTRAGCAKHADELAAAVAAALGRNVRVTVVVEAGVERPTGSRGTPAPPVEEAEEPVDLTELVDAPGDDGVVARLTSAFPGAELIEHD